jgi:hypothetical protein
MYTYTNLLTSIFLAFFTFTVHGFLAYFLCIEKLLESIGFKNASFCNSVWRMVFKKDLTMITNRVKLMNIKPLAEWVDQF